MSVILHSKPQTIRPGLCILLAGAGGILLFFLAAAAAAQIMIKGNLSGGTAPYFALTALCAGCFSASWLSVRMLRRCILLFGAGWAFLYSFLPLGLGYLCGLSLPEPFPTVRIAVLLVCGLAGAVLGAARKTKRKQVV